MPVAFSPNGDEKNDTWGVSGHGIKTLQVEVYNRWGEKIWEGSSLSDFWDGTVNSNPVAQDVYVWMVSYTYDSLLGSDQTRTKIGHVTIFR